MSAADVIRRWYDRLNNTSRHMPALLVGIQGGGPDVHGPPGCSFAEIPLLATAWPNTGPSSDYPGTGLAADSRLLFRDRKNGNQPFNIGQGEDIHVRLRVDVGDLVIHNHAYRTWHSNLLHEAGPEMLTAPARESIGNKSHTVTWYVLLNSYLGDTPG